MFRKKNRAFIFVVKKALCGFVRRKNSRLLKNKITDNATLAIPASQA